MSTIIKFGLRELRNLTTEPNSCVVEKRVRQNLALQPRCLGNPKDSLKNLLDYKIGKYDKEFDGILLSYKNLKVLQNTGAICHDSGNVLLLVQADYYIFRPYIGSTLVGIVNKKYTTHLGILVHGVFNVVIPRPTDELGGKWIGTDTFEGQEVLFKVIVLDLYGALPYIRGELLEDRFMKRMTDDDYTTISTTSQQSALYVNLDKTKPNIQNQNSYDFDTSSQISHTSGINTRIQNKSAISNTKQSISDASKFSSSLNCKRRLSKTPEKASIALVDNARQKKKLRKK